MFQLSEMIHSSMTTKTKAVNGKSKGNSFERKIANLLSDRFKGYLKEDKGFRRNPDSGSFFGGSNTRRQETHNLDYAVFGDLICPRNFKYALECKHYKSAPTFQSVFDQQVTQWDGWLVQAKQDSINAGKEMMLIVKYNNVKEIAFLSKPLKDTDYQLRYKEYYVYKLESVLAHEDAFFFVNLLL